MKGTKKWGRGGWLRVLTFVLLSIVKHQTAKIISNTENFWSFLEQYIANIFFHVATGIPYIISHITPPSVHLSRQKSTKHGLEVNPFSMDWGIVIPHKTQIRRHWPSLGCLRIVYIVQKECALGLKSSPSRSCCRTSLPLWCRSAGRC